MKDNKKKKRMLDCAASIVAGPFEFAVNFVDRKDGYRFLYVGLIQHVPIKVSP